jgi:hypothetical protein
MKLEAFIRVLAGSVVLVSVALTHLFSPWWTLLTVFVGVNLIQAVFTGFCPPCLILRKLDWVDSDDIIHWGGMKKPQPRAL